MKKKFYKTLLHIFVYMFFIASIQNIYAQDPADCNAIFSYEPYILDNGQVVENTYRFFTETPDNSHVTWNFNNGETIEGNPIIFEATPGYYSVCLVVVNDNCEARTCEEVQLGEIETAPCNAAFSYHTADENTYFDDGIAYIKFVPEMMSDNTTYKWTFSDNEISNEISPIHIFEPNSTGVYNVCLTIVRDDGCESTECMEVVIDNRNPDCTPSFDWYYSDEMSIPEYIQIVFEGFTNFEVAEWNWDFGDGEIANGQTAKHGYYFLTDNEIKACLTTISVDDCKATSCQTINLNNNPNECWADIDVAIMESYPPQYQFYPVLPDFIDASTVEYFWDFGDGESSAEYSPVHVYEPETGVYNACLHIVTSDGCQSVRCYEIDTGGEIQECYVKFEAMEAPENKNSVQFIAYTEEQKTELEWHFGDGTVSHEKNPVHTYNEAGVYNVGSL